METINEGAKYFKAGKMIIDMRDIKNLALLGYAPKNNKNEPDENKPVYRIIFKDNSYIEQIIDKNSLACYNEFVESEKASTASE